MILSPDKVMRDIMIGLSSAASQQLDLFGHVSSLSSAAVPFLVTLYVPFPLVVSVQFFTSSRPYSIVLIFSLCALFMAIFSLCIVYGDLVCHCLK